MTETKQTKTIISIEFGPGLIIFVALLLGLIIVLKLFRG